MQLTGTARILADPDDVAAVLRGQLARLQPDIEVVDPSEHARRLGAIRAARIDIEEVRAKFKYGGNVDAAHRRAAAERLEARGGPGDQAAAARVRDRLEPAEPDTTSGPHRYRCTMTDELSRRTFLAGLGAASGLAAAGLSATPAGATNIPGHTGQPGDRPFPRHPEGTEFLPRIEHIIIYMQENHSYDSYYGMLPRGDGYTLARRRPARTATRCRPPQNLSVFHAPDTCQLGEGVSQNWANTHTQIDNGRMDGFLFNGNTNAMRYWDGTDLPFYYSLAQTFPICDRWFASAPCQTYPNRLYLQAATCQSLIAPTSTEVLAPAAPGRRHHLGQAQRLRHHLERLRLGPARHRPVPAHLPRPTVATCRRSTSS